MKRRADWHWVTLGLGGGVAFVFAFVLAVGVQIHPTVIQESENCHEAIAFWTKRVALEERLSAKWAKYGNGGPTVEAAALAKLDREHARDIACR